MSRSEIRYLTGARRRILGEVKLLRVRVPLICKSRPSTDYFFVNFSDIFGVARSLALFKSLFASTSSAITKA